MRKTIDQKYLEKRGIDIHTPIKGRKDIVRFFGAKETPLWAKIVTVLSRDFLDDAELRQIAREAVSYFEKNEAMSGRYLSQKVSRAAFAVAHLAQGVEFSEEMSASRVELGPAVSKHANTATLIACLKGALCSDALTAARESAVFLPPHMTADKLRSILIKQIAQG
jgi:hypothetical protein